MYIKSLLWSFCLCATMQGVVQPNTVIATVNTGVTPAGLAITPDGKFAYVANNNNYSIAGQDSVSVINLTTNMPETIITDGSFDEPYTVTINATGTKAYVTNSNGATVTVIDIATNTVIAVISGFDGPSGFVITPDGNTAYVNNYGGPIVGSGNGTTVRVVDLNTNTIVGPAITVALAPAAMAITPDGAYVYVACYVDGNPGTGIISIIDTATNTAIINAITGFSGPFDIVITPDGNYAYISNFGSNNFTPFGTTVSVVDLNSNTIVGTIIVGIQPSGIAITPNGKYAYVTNYNALYADSVSFTDLTPGQGTVNIIDIATNTLLPVTIAVDQAPSAIAITPDGRFAYVSNYISNTVNVIALPTSSITGTGCQTRNRFLMQENIVNKLTWSAYGISLPVSYALYRDEALTDLVAIVPATTMPMTYFDRDVSTDGTYYIVGINDAETASYPLEIVVTQTC